MDTHRHDTALINVTTLENSRYGHRTNYHRVLQPVPARKNLPSNSPQAHRCTITLLLRPAASIVTLSSSRVRFGKVVPMVYGRALFSGRELGEKGEVVQLVAKANHRGGEKKK